MVAIQSNRVYSKVHTVGLHVDPATWFISSQRPMHKIPVIWHVQPCHLLIETIDAQYRIPS